MRATMNPESVLITVSSDAEKLARRLVPLLGENVTVYSYRQLSDLSDSTLLTLNRAPMVLISAVLGNGEIELSVAHLLRAIGLRSPILLAALADRGGRTVPIEADMNGGDLIVAESLSVSLNEEATDWM
jgi:pyrimidine operon attenuation protein/uracil phosphoribosyltransferase